MDIGSTIELLRKRKNISQKSLADLAGITQSYLSQIEGNKKDPNMKTLQDISNALEIPLPFLLLNSISIDDVPTQKQDAFKIVMPLLKSLLSGYLNDADNDKV
ncbi:MAG: helix-turn-helix transcriptional regulator [Bacteroidetes bacterium]|nr:helix-turn-helix transcriptional regulator [Bacteroidota bacterium]